MKKQIVLSLILISSFASTAFAGKTPLIDAIQNGNKDEVECLIKEKNADPDECCSGGATPWYYTRCLKDWEKGYEMLELLFELGADPNKETKDSFQRTITPLDFAIDRGDKELAKILLQHSANPSKIKQYTQPIITTPSRNNYEDYLWNMENVRLFILEAQKKSLENPNNQPS